MLPRVFAALRAADEITLGHLNRVRIRHKADGSEVTVADKSAERLLRRHLQAAWPQDALLGEEYGGALGRRGRCWLSRDGGRPRRVRVGAPRALSAAQVGLTSFKESDLLRRPGPWRLTNLARTAGRVRLVGDCVQYALLCRGVLDAAIDPLMKPWDIGAIAPCVIEAGGSLGDLNGNTSRIVERTSLVAASTPALRRAISRATRP